MNFIKILSRAIAWIFIFAIILSYDFRSTLQGKDSKMATSRASSGLPYPERFYVAAAYAGFGGSPGDSTAVSRFQNDVALLLYGLYQQVRSAILPLPGYLYG